ncbi:MAG: type II toxin-antitoxin system Phd/YefM family antitoxin [Polyangiaceae bacterium]|nr:type II toxin-antitoxin system Phd/YefM family antitoxin [Polyangiaceae bacterium]
MYEAKTQLSRLLRRVRAGEEIIIADAGRPVARLVPLESAEGPRCLGGDERAVWIADDFDAPLSDEVIAAFYGEAIAPGKGARRTGHERRRR